MISPEYAEVAHLTHHALQDALDQTRLFKKILAEIHNRNLDTRS
jgi:inhibitor of KinA sporulation pathway (predicted exonuclease)